MSAFRMTKEQPSARHDEVRQSVPTTAFAAAGTTVLFAAPVAANEECPTSLNQMAAVIGVQADEFAAFENEDQPALETATFRYAEGQSRVVFMKSMRESAAD